MAKKMVSFHSITRAITKTQKSLRALQSNVTGEGKAKIKMDLAALRDAEEKVKGACDAQDFLHHLQWFELVPKKKKK
jgi:hypothetical protein